MRLVVLRQIPLITEYLTRFLVKSFALAHMEVCCTSSNRKVLNGMVLSKTMRYDGRVLLILTHLDFFLIEPYIKTSIGLLELGNVEVVY